MFAMALIMASTQLGAQCELMCNPPAYVMGSTTGTAYPGCIRTIFYTYQICGGQIDLVDFYVIVTPTGGPMAPGCDDYIHADIQKIIQDILTKTGTTATTMILPASCATRVITPFAIDGGVSYKHTFTPCSPGCCEYDISTYLAFDFSTFFFGNDNCPPGCTAMCAQ